MMTRQRKTEQQDVGDDKSQCEDLSWRQTIQKQHLRKNEGATPYCHRDKGDKMINESIV